MTVGSFRTLQPSRSRSPTPGPRRVRTRPPARLVVRKVILASAEQKASASDAPDGSGASARWRTRGGTHEHENARRRGDHPNHRDRAGRAARCIGQAPPGPATRLLGPPERHPVHRRRHGARAPRAGQAHGRGLARDRLRPVDHGERGHHIPRWGDGLRGGGHRHRDRGGDPQRLALHGPRQPGTRDRPGTGGVQGQGDRPHHRPERRRRHAGGLRGPRPRPGSGRGDHRTDGRRTSSY